jgi:hypothetical protein
MTRNHFGVKSLPDICDWSQLPLTLTVDHVAKLYQVSPWTVREKVRERRSAQIPRPDMLDPMRWKRDTVKRHYERVSVAEQRAEKITARMERAGLTVEHSR